jgi:translation initiation factor 2 beta subunit (eIF-2beta)/eIF-5
MVYNPSYLLKSRHGVYYFRYPIPSSIHPQMKREALQVSLKTMCRKEALACSARLRYAVCHLITYLESMPVDYIEKKQLIQKCFKDMLEADRAEMHKGGLLSTEEVTQSEQLASRIERSQAHLLASHVIEDIKKEAGLEGCDDPDVKVEILRGLSHYNRSRIRLNKELSDPSYTMPSQVAANVSQSAPVNDRERTSLVDAFGRYFEENKSIWKPSTVRDYKTYVRFLCAELGESAAVGSLSYEQVELVEDALGATDKAARTKTKYASFYRTFFSWCQGKGYRKEPLFDHLKFKGDEGGRDVRGFTSDELVSIYCALEEYKESCSQSNRPKIHNYWISMMLMFTGARSNEIAQLYVKDIQSDDGIDYIVIDDSHDNQSIKNDASRRNVPLHPHLIDLGFLDYVVRGCSLI